MIENLIEYIKDEDYLVGIYKGTTHIFNYIKILDISPNEIFISLKNQKLKLFGENLIVKKMDKNEILIKGKIKRVDFIE